MIRLDLPRHAVVGYPDEREIIEAITSLPGFDPYKSTGGAKFEWEVAADWVYLWRSCITHIEGVMAGKPYRMEKHELGIFCNVMGWIQPAEGDLPERRRFRDVFYFVPQGNSKSTFAAGWMTLLTAFDSEPGAQNISTAATRDQANLVRRMVVGMIDNDDDLKAAARVYQHSITCDDRYYKTVPAEAASAHGANLYFVINDEVHAHKTPAFLDVVKRKAKKRGNSLIVNISTADYLREGSACNDLYDRAKAIIDGKIDVPSFLPAIYEISPEEMRDDPECWKKPEYWYKANPLLGKSISYEDFAAMAKEAEESMAQQNEFLRICLNVRTQSQTTMIDMGNWINNCGGALDISDFIGREPAGAGLDLGQTSDFTVLCVLYDLNPELNEIENREYAAFWFHWTPEETARKREQLLSGAQYETWARAGHMKLTGGNETDWNEIFRDLNTDNIPEALKGMYAPYPGMAQSITTTLGIKKIAIDRLFQGHQLSQDIANEGIDVVDFGQGFMSMAAPTMEFIKLVNSGRLKHGDNPVVSWQAGNVQAKMDAAGLIKPDKAKSGDKIDGIVALIMALGMAMERENPPESMLEKMGGIVYV